MTTLHRPEQTLAESLDYVLPKPPRPVPGVVVVPSAPVAAPRLPDADAAARQLGRRWQVTVASQGEMLADLRQRLLDLDADIAEAPRAQWKAGIAEALGMLDWCHAAQQDLAAQAAAAADGRLPLGLGGLVEEVARVATAVRGAPVHCRGEAANAYWARPADVVDLVDAGLDLLADRQGAAAPIEIEVAATAHGPELRFAGHGEAQPDLDAEVVARFRAAAERLGAAVLPGPLGPGAPAFAVRLPQPPES